jgi:hypothetical protein
MARRDIIQDFVNQKSPTSGKNKGRIAGEYGHIFYEGDILYDFGHHFPMLIRHKWGYLLNADKYSSTTSKHQGKTDITEVIEFQRISGEHSLTQRQYDALINKAQKYHDKKDREAKR